MRARRALTPVFEQVPVLAATTPPPKGQLTSQLLDRLFALETFGIKLGLDNITTLCEALGHPERSFTSLHVAGTNGGSVTAMAHAALRAAGVHAAHISPHLSDLSERFVVAIARSTARRLEAVVDDVLACADRLQATRRDVDTADVLRGHHCGSVRAVSSRRDRDRRDRGRAGWTLRRDQRHLAGRPAPSPR